MRGVFPNKDEVLSPGFFARVRVPIGRPHKALLVSDRALDTDQGQKVVYVVDKDNEVVSRPVRLGALHDGLREITDGLKPGERVIVNGLQQVRPGVTVEPKLVDMPVPSSRHEQPAKSDETDPERRPAMLARFFIDRPVLAWVISIVIVLLGAIAAGFLPIAEYPEITPPTVRVTANYPGANAQVVADTVAAPIEQQVNGVEEMMYMSSQSNNDGSYTLDVTFELGTDINMAQVLVQNRVAIAEPTLPDVVRTIGVTTKKRSPDILLGISLYSEDNPETGRPYYDSLYLSNYATIQLKDAIARLEGVGDVIDPRPAGLQHARLARPGQAAVAEPDGRRRDPGPARAERAGGGRADRPAAGPQGPGLPVHAEHPRPAGRGRAVRQHHPQDRLGRGSHLPQGRQPDRAGGPEPGHARRGWTAGRRRAWPSSCCPARTPWTPPTASRPRCGSWKPASPRGCITPSSTTPRRSSASRSTRCSTRCATPSSWWPSSSCCSCRTGRPCSCP